MPWSGKALLGSMVFGWVLFNLVEGVIDHHILHVHHVVERLGVLAWNWAFLGSGALFMAVGWAMIRASRHDGALAGRAG